MSEPFVCCITPTRDRPEYLKRAVECFRAQAYKNKALYILNSASGWLDFGDKRIVVHNAPHRAGKSIGYLRNEIIGLVDADLIAHFDDDDWSHPLRLAEQVEFIERMGCGVVGYGDMPFYDVERDKVLFYDSRNPHYALGTSLMYRREVWERVPFPDQTPEDTTWQNIVGPSNVFSCSSVAPDGLRMVQTIHKGNASPKTGSRFQPASAEMEQQVRRIVAREPIAAT